MNRNKSISPSHPWRIYQNKPRFSTKRRRTEVWAFIFGVHESYSQKKNALNIHAFLFNVPIVIRFDHIFIDIPSSIIVTIIYES